LTSRLMIFPILPWELYPFTTYTGYVCTGPSPRGLPLEDQKNKHFQFSCLIFDYHFPQNRTRHCVYAPFWCKPSTISWTSQRSLMCFGG
jgi:hypothetical protein